VAQAKYDLKTLGEIALRERAICPIATDSLLSEQPPGRDIERIAPQVVGTTSQAVQKNAGESASHLAALACWWQERVATYERNMGWS
jgi:hypothetical protein